MLVQDLLDQGGIASCGTAKLVACLVALDILELAGGNCAAIPTSLHHKHYRRACNKSFKASIALAGSCETRRLERRRVSLMRCARFAVIPAPSHLK